MAKSIIDIDVNAQSFKDFQVLFSKYQDQLSKMPEAWKNVDASVKSVTDSFAKHVDGGTADAFAEGAAAAQAMSDAMASADVSTKAAGRSMVDLAKTSKAIAGSILGATKNLAEWSALAAGAGLLGGGGMLWGMDRLADTVSGQRRAAQGLGITTGEQQAFGLTIGKRLIDPSMIQNVSDISADVNQNWKFGALGITSQQLNNDDNAQLSIDVLKRAHAMWKQFSLAGKSKNVIKQVMDAYGLSGFMQVDEFRRIGNTSDAEFNSDLNQFQSAAQALNTSDPTQKAWQDLSVQLGLAGHEIEKVFVTGLVGLAPNILKLSASLTATLGTFLGNPHLKTDIDDFGRGIGVFATYLGSQKFQSDMSIFASSIGEIVHNIEHPIQAITGAAGFTSKPGSAIPPNADALINPKGWSTWFGTFSAYPPDFTSPEKQFGLPQGLLANVMKQESGGNNFAVSPRGADFGAGAFQLSKGIREQYGVTDSADTGQEAYAAADYLSSLMTKYKQDLTKAVAAYDWGPGNVDKDVAAHGKNWKNYLPKETQGYIKNVSRGITININNQTGANVAVLTNAAGAQ